MKKKKVFKLGTKEQLQIELKEAYHKINLLEDEVQEVQFSEMKHEKLLRDLRVLYDDMQRLSKQRLADNEILRKQLERFRSEL